MSETENKVGVFGVHRSVWDHDLFASKDPFSEREAWLWMVSAAAWKDTRCRVGTAIVNLKRGQLAFSTRFLAGKWRWAEARVRRFLNRLKTDAMVSTDTDAGVTRITICNYDRYQIVGLPSDAPIDAQTDAASTQHRRKEEEDNNLRRKEDTPSEQAAPAGNGSVSEAEVFKVGKAVLGKSAGGMITNLRKLCGYDNAVALSWLRAAGEKESPREWLSAVLRKSDPLEIAYEGVVGYRSPHETSTPTIQSKEDREYDAWRDDYYKSVH